MIFLSFLPFNTKYLNFHVQNLDFKQKIAILKKLDLPILEQITRENYR